ncbi:MAG: zinc metallopeptidase [Phyllobacteriaceae bacterium]|nr:zinc metallopeptidase [Phyllobacteriaceae bacterium]
MRWRDRRQSDNIEDARDQSGGGLPGGLGRGGGFRLPGGSGVRVGRSGGGLSGIIILVVLFFALRACGIDPIGMLSGEDPSQPSQPRVEAPAEPGAPAATDEDKAFVATVLAETEDVWNGIFKAEGFKYEEPVLTLFSGQIGSACGYASAASGPFYCPGDRKVYLDTAFFDQLARQFGAKGDFARAYVIAHEVGHHVQNLIGVLPKFNEMRQGMDEVEANRMSVRVELQADCFAGIWAHFTERKGLLEQGDIEEALNAANQIGDDTLQKKTQGYVVPDAFNHGTSAQRKEWFYRGYENGRFDACDSFNADI